MPRAVICFLSFNMLKKMAQGRLALRLPQLDHIDQIFDACLSIKEKVETMNWVNTSYPLCWVTFHIYRPGMACVLQVAHDQCEYNTHTCLIGMHCSCLMQPSYHAKERLDVVHGNQYGPVVPAMYGRKVYFILMADNMSHYIHVAPPALGQGLIKKFQASVEDESGRKMCAFLPIA